MTWTHILFDLDGTLTDPGVGITNSVAYALERYGVSVPDRRTLYPFIGPPLTESFQRYYAFSPADARAEIARYSNRALHALEGLHADTAPLRDFAERLIGRAK